jgi:hypothetical protein
LFTNTSFAVQTGDGGLETGEIQVHTAPFVFHLSYPIAYV